MNITTLQPDEVFVFGSNNSGFHGAGAAGFAFSGSAANDWRTSFQKQAAINSPVGYPARVGRWAVWGIAEGFQEGREGQSYAIRTVVHPGSPKIPLPEIEAQFQKLWDFAIGHPKQTFLLTEVGCGLAGYNRAELRAIIDNLICIKGIPANIRNANAVYRAYRHILR